MITPRGKERKRGEEGDGERGEEEGRKRKEGITENRGGE